MRYRFARKCWRVVELFSLAQLVPFLPFRTTLAQQPLGPTHFGPASDEVPFPRPLRQVENFTEYGGTWTVKSDELWTEAGPGPKLISDTPEFSVGEVGVEILLPGDHDGNAALIARVREAGVGADHFIGYEIALDARNQVLRLGRHRHNFELIRDVPCQVPTGQWISLVVKIDKTSLEVLLDGNSVLHHDDGANALPAGAVGLRPWQRDARYRNLWVKTNGQHHQSCPFNRTRRLSMLTSYCRMPVFHRWHFSLATP